MITGSKPDAEEMLPNDIDDGENAVITTYTYAAIRVKMSNSNSMKNSSEVENNKVSGALLLAMAIGLVFQKTTDIAEKTQQSHATQVSAADDSSPPTLQLTNDTDSESENFKNNTSPDVDTLNAHTQADVSQDNSDGRSEGDSSTENFSKLSSITATFAASSPIADKGGGLCLAPCHMLKECIQICKFHAASFLTRTGEFCQSSLGSYAVRDLSNDANEDPPQIQDTTTASAAAAAAAATTTTTTTSNDENELNRREEELRQTDPSVSICYISNVIVRFMLAELHFVLHFAVFAVGNRASRECLCLRKDQALSSFGGKIYCR